MRFIVAIYILGGKYNKQMAASSKSRTSKPRRRQVRRMRPKSSTTNVSEWASLSQTKALLNPSGANLPFAADTMYSVLNVNLSAFDRASDVAKAYQFYRIKNIRMTFKSPLDTFNGAVGSGPKPQLYYMIDKSASVPLGATLTTLKAMGARPKMFDEKNFQVNWKPSILVLAESLAGSTPSEYKISPWLSTEANAINHLGIYFISDCLASASAVGYYVDIEVQFEFKKPLWEVPPPPTDGSTQPLATPCVFK